MRTGIAFAGDISGSGGMQRAAVTLAGALAARGHRVSIGYGDTSGRPLFFSLPPAVEVMSLLQLCGIEKGSLGSHISGGRKAVRELIRPFGRRAARSWNEKAKAALIRPGIRKWLAETQPDVVLSFSPDMTYYLQCSGCTRPIVTLFRIEPRYILSIAPQMEIEAVNRSQAVQIQMPFFREQIAQYCGPVPTVCIPNPVPQPEEAADLSREKDVYTIIDVARIDKKQKRQHLLLEAFAQVAGRHPDWQLAFWGNTTAHAAYARELADRIRALGLTDRVFLKGETKHITEVYRSADIFAFPSAFEGFPNALAEAMAHGLPPLIAADCPSATALATDGETGLSAADVEEAAEKLDRLMDDRAERMRLGENARGAMKQYAPSQVWDSWEQLLTSLV